jgi:type IV pilus assembly protein PilQ
MKMNRRAVRWLIGGVCVAALASLASGAAFAAPKQALPAASRATTSFNFDNIPVRSALQVLAEEGHFNLVVSDSVQGKITLRLRNVTWQQALDTVLRLKGLQQHVDGKTRSVTTAGG